MARELLEDGDSETKNIGLRQDSRILRIMKSCTDHKGVH